MPGGTAAELPAFYIGVFDDADVARRVERGDAEWDVVVVSVSYTNDPLASSGPREPPKRRLRRIGNVVVEYDPSDRRLVRRIEAALRALDGRQG